MMRCSYMLHGTDLSQKFTCTLPSSMRALILVDFIKSHPYGMKLSSAHSIPPLFPGTTKTTVSLVCINSCSNERALGAAPCWIRTYTTFASLFCDVKPGLLHLRHARQVFERLPHAPNVTPEVMECPRACPGLKHLRRVR
jgi:hypothetical protein